jgi:hypothetical protein
MPFARSAGRLYKTFIAIVMAVSLHTQPIYCQSSSAALTVSVTDATGASIPGASLDVRNATTNQSQHLRSSSKGTADFAFLKPGIYQLTVAKEHFADVVVNNLVLNVGDARRLDIALKIGPANQTVTVDGTGPTLNTTDASVSTVVDQKFVKNMPLNGRSFQDLISMTPGVTTQSSQSNGFVQYQGDFSVNGQRTESNYYTVDGVSANTGAGYPNGGAQIGTSGSISNSTALGTTQSLVSVDALQEFRVSSSTYSAEYGRTPGGQFSMATRSGTNSVHGTAFDYLRNDVFDANNWFNDFNGIQKTALRQNDFGGTVGGPISIPRLYSGRNRSYFFFSYEGLRLVQPTAATAQYVPSLAVRAAAPSPTKEILNAFPLPTGPELSLPSGALSGLSSFVKAYSLPANIDATSIRADQRFGSRASGFFRYSHTPTATSSRTLSSLARQEQNSDTYTLGLDIVQSNTSSNSTRIGISHSTSQQVMNLDNFGGATPTSLKDSIGVPGSSDTYSFLSLLYASGVGTSSIQQYKASNELRQWNLTDIYAFSLGHHQIRAGFDQRRFTSPLNPPEVQANPYYFSRAAMITNTPTEVPLYKTVPSKPLFNEFSAFVQDEWRISPSLSLSAGLRWEVNPAPSAADGRNAYTLLGDPANPASLSLASRGTSLWRTSWYNLAPRLGFAWAAHGQPGHETVLRAGGGVFFDTGNQTSAQGFSGLGFIAYTVPTNVTLPVASSYFNFSTDVTSPYTNSTVYAFPQHLQLPYTLQWNVGLDQSLGAKQVVTIGYVASAGRRLLQERDMYISASNPLFNLAVFYPNGLTSNYQSLQLKYQRSMAHGLQALASYTWSHSLDYGSTNQSYAYTYGNSDFDLRNNLQAGLSWDIPQLRQHSLANKILGGWGLDGRVIVRSAFPITLVGNYLLDSSGTVRYSGVDYDSSKPVYLHGRQYPGGKIVNGGPSVPTANAAFRLPSGSDPGNAARNFVRAFGASQVNMALRRDVHLVEALSFQFRAETFNVLNNPSFGYVDPYLTDSTFGRATQTLNTSLGSVSSLYQQGGPRSMQFSLKLLF